jgi:hypothetical protein
MSENKVIGGEFAVAPQELNEHIPVTNIEYSSGRAALFSILENVSKISEGGGD